MPLDTDRIKNVLVLAPDKHMGDLMLSLPAINALRNFFREKTFYLVIDNAYTEIIETLEGTKNLVLYPRKQLNSQPFIKRMRTLFDFFRKLRKASPDIAIDLQGGVSSSTMTFLSGAPLRVGRATAKRPYFYNLKVNVSKGKHKVYTYTEIIAAAGITNVDHFLRIRQPEEKISDLKALLLKEGILLERPIACIHPGAGVIYKQWTEEGFACISEWLCSRGFQVVFTGSGNESGKIRNITSRIKDHTYDLAGKLTVGELLSLLKISSLYIGNDSGPMHLAAAAGTPLIALFGPAAEQRWGPLSEKAITLRGAEPCRKCTRNSCEYDFKCIKNISVDDVKNAVNKLIGPE